MLLPKIKPRTIKQEEFVLAQKTFSFLNGGKRFPIPLINREHG
jgi:hypothetical protein